MNPIWLLSKLARETRNKRKKTKHTKSSSFRMFSFFLFYFVFLLSFRLAQLDGFVSSGQIILDPPDGEDQEGNERQLGNELK